MDSQNTSEGSSHGDDHKPKKRTPYDGSTPAKVYPKSLKSIDQAKGALKRLDLRAKWIMDRHKELESQFQSVSEDTAKFPVMDEDKALKREMANLRDKRAKVRERERELVAEHADEIKTYRFETFEW